MADASIRLDKWLWYARVTKTRTLARKLVTAGKVRVNRIKVTVPARTVAAGDVLTIAAQQRILVYEIVDVGQRRGPYSEARLLYVDHSAPVEVQAPESPTGTGKRPDPRQRRAIAALRGKIA